MGKSRLIMDSRTREFLKGVKIAYPTERTADRKFQRAKLPRYWVVERPLIEALNKGAISADEFVLLMRIENLCYYDGKGNLHPFFGSNRYLASKSDCQVRTIQNRIASLKKKGFLVVWTRVIPPIDEFSNPITRRYMCTAWSRTKITGRPTDKKS